ncbi:MAG: hypothetical protein JRN39_02730 [Nitrososphaerota archaeon]|nr:hypothetical protein [Nitrososphaerota archaeon]
MVKAIFRVCRRQHIPLYSRKALWQHIALVALMQRVREYTDDFLTVADGLVSALDSPISRP